MSRHRFKMVRAALPLTLALFSCLVLGSTAVAHGSTPGSGWSVRPIPEGVGTLNQVACMNKSDCLAAGSTGTGTSGSGLMLTTSNGGITWSKQVVPGGAGGLTAVFCLPSSTDCWAGGEGGSGDILAGLIAGLWASGYPALESCKLGTYLLGRAGEIYEEKWGSESAIARDILKLIPAVFSDINRDFSRSA